MNKSETIKELATALCKANTEISRVAKDAANPFFKSNYATLDNIIDSVRPILSKNGLSVMQMPSSGEGNTIEMQTLIIHESGEWMESEPLRMTPVKNDPQSIGSCITYARRYSLGAFLSISTGEDDDGNAATHSNNKAPEKNQGPQQPPEEKQLAANLIKKLHVQRQKLGASEDDFKAGLTKMVGFEVKSLHDLAKLSRQKLNDLMDAMDKRIVQKSIATTAESEG